MILDLDSEYLVTIRQTEKPKFEVVIATGGGGGGGGGGGSGARRKRQTSTRIVDKKAPKPSDLGEVPSSITTEFQVNCVQICTTAV